MSSATVCGRARRRRRTPGLAGSAARAGGMEQALGSLSGTLLTAVALGLLLFGLFSFVERGTGGSTIRTWRRG